MGHRVVNSATAARQADTATCKTSLNVFDHVCNWRSPLQIANVTNNNHFVLSLNTSSLFILL